MSHGLDGHIQHLLTALAHLPLQVRVGGAHERVDARIRGVLQRLGGTVYVFEQDPGQTADRRPLDLQTDAAHGFEILVRRDRETRLDDVDLQPGQLVGDLQLVAHPQRGARRLLGVTQRRVENDDAVLLIVVCVGLCHAVSAPSGAGRYGA